MAKPSTSESFRSDLYDVTDLIKTNSRLHNTIEKFEINLKKTGKARITISFLEVRAECLAGYWQTFQDTHNKIMSMVDDEEEKTVDYCVQNIYDIVEELYLTAATYINEKLRELSPPSTSSSSNSGTAPNNNDLIPTATVQQLQPKALKLPAISIPKFDGTYQQWPAFFDLFKSLIHNNQSIEQVHKLHYLKSCLSGDAEHLLRHFQITSLNYAPAWEMLVNRYENKRILINAQLNRLFNQTRLNHDSAQGVKSLLDTTVECLHSLRNFGVITTHWDVLLNYLIVQRLTPETHLLWEQNLEGSRDIPTFQQMSEFLESRYRTLEIMSTKSSNVSQSNRHSNNGIKKTQSYHTSEANPNTIYSCVLCSQNHSIRQCEQFDKMPIPSRAKLVSSKSLCTNCLSSNHTCSKCPSKKRCLKCRKRHHTMLHVASESTSANSSPSTSTSSESAKASNEVNSFHISSAYNPGQILLATAIVRVTSENGNELLLRALLDQGSESSFITESAAQRLRLKRERILATISGIGEGCSTSTSQVNICLNAHFQQKLNLSVNLLVLKSLTRRLPSANLNNNSWAHVQDLKLADPQFASSSNIDLVLGADVYCRVLMDGVRLGAEGSPVAQKTRFGWILSGLSSNNTSSSATTFTTLSHVSRVDLDDELKRFWELEEVSLERKLTQEELYCEKLFEESFQRNVDGRCIVKLPFKTEFGTTKTLGRSKQIAVNRFMQLERSFKVKTTYRQLYSSCLQEYIDLNHMEPVPNDEEHLKKTSTSNGMEHGCYLPHHGVLKEASSTTKLRVVFDASQATYSGSSLNDVLLTGPRLQEDLITIITRWRKYRIAMTADIEKMYRQVLVSKEDADFQKIVWRAEPDSELVTYRLLTLTFGTSSAPYLAVKTLQHLAKLEQQKYPLAAQSIMNNFYVDDLLSGADELSEAILRKDQLITLLQGAGFELRKWTSNSKQFLCNIPPDHQETKFPLHINEENTIKTLGLYWHPSSDSFQFQICMSPLPEQWTKRRILSDIAKLFDPSGWLAPVTITAKMILQSLWLTGLNWDDKLPDSITNNWVNYRGQLKDVEKLRIKRWINITPNATSFQLHCFCDASQMAYAAVAYLRIVDESGIISVHLLAAKTKVAPLKTVSLARLELCGAVLAARLIDRMRRDLQLPTANIFTWTDATIVLAWLKNHPQKWSTFIANRVVEIHQLIPSSSWNHIAGQNNPADCASRGITPTAIQNHSLWWNGPSWLTKSEALWPVQPLTVETSEELRKVTIIQANVAIALKEESDFFNRFSTLTKAVRCIAYCRRFIFNAKPKSTKCFGFLSTCELKSAMQILLLKIQSIQFSIELKLLTESKPLPSSSKLLNLTPFIDSNGLIRVGGRLQRSNLKYESKHPIIMPKHNHVTTLIINHYHILTLHGGPQLTMSMIREKYWILDSRNTIRHQINKCITCHRHKATVHTQLMGQLPVNRVTAHRPFLHTGVDYAGPFDIKWNKGRNTKTYKAYISLFVCLAVKCIHLELVTDLSTPGFIAAYRRFTARRGLCNAMYSDCGTNFVGAAKVLKNDFNRSRIEHDMAELLATDGCEWHFIPPGSPNFGGLWEAGVKSMKNHLKRAIGNTLLTYEEFTTCLHQIEAVLNSRPLCPVTNDPSDLEVLTPGHFMIGDRMVTPPEPTLLDISTNKLNRWQNVQHMFQSFWKRWHLEYLSNLQQRPKWLVKNRNIQPNDLVLIKDDRMPPSKWLLGRILDTTEGADNLVRVANIKTKNGIITRSISKISLLPIDSICTPS